MDDIKRNVQLYRIAEALDVPVSVLIDDPDALISCEDAEKELLLLASSLSNPRDRQRLVAIARSFVRFVQRPR